MNNEHTGLPWQQGTDERQIESSVDGTIICLVQGAKSHPATLPDARLIVTSVNYHHQLRSIAARIVADYEYWQNDEPGPDDIGDIVLDARDILCELDKLEQTNDHQS